MRWKNYRQSSNVEDRRGMSAGRGAAIGGGGIVLVLVLSLLTGQNPMVILDEISGTQSQVGAGGGEQGQLGAPSDEMGQFASAILASTEDVWSQLIDGYQPPRLVLFSDAVNSACGYASAAAGPFYCPGDSQVYIDLAFFNALTQRFGAPGDFAQAYVIAHEIGHHVQNQLGLYERMAQARRGASERQVNAESVKVELQADCLAGVWGYHARQAGLIEAGDFEEGLKAASAIGDDTLQKQSQGYVVPESFTHGSSAERVENLRRGMQSGDPRDCGAGGAL